MPSFNGKFTPIPTVFLSLCSPSLLSFLVPTSSHCFVYRCNSSIDERIEKAKRKQRQNDEDSFREENGYSWDYVLVFKVYQEEEGLTEFQRKFSMKYVLESLTQAGLSIRSFYSIKV